MSLLQITGFAFQRQPRAHLTFVLASLPRLLREVRIKPLFLEGGVRFRRSGAGKPLEP